MKEKIYTIKNLCNELNQPRQKVRRRIEKLDIKAINEDTRIHENEPLEYDHQAFLKLAKEFDVKINNTECTASVQHRTAEETSKDKLIKVLENQLEEANKSRANLEKLLDQQQQLQLATNRQIEQLQQQNQLLLSNNAPKEEEADDTITNATDVPFDLDFENYQKTIERRRRKRELAEQRLNQNKSNQPEKSKEINRKKWWKIW